MADPITLFTWTCCFCGVFNDPATTQQPLAPTSLNLTTPAHTLTCRLCAKPPCPTCDVDAASVGPPEHPTTLYMKLAPPRRSDLVAHGYICPYCGGAAVQNDVASLLERAAHEWDPYTAGAATRFERHGHRHWHYLEPVLPRCALCARRVTRPGERLEFWLVKRGAASKLHADIVRWWTGEAAAERVQPGLVERLKSAGGAWDAWATWRDSGMATNAGLVFLFVLSVAAG